VEFPAHNSYRSLTLRIFRAAGIPPEPCPTAEEVRTLRARGIERLWAWPYFLLDEVDDGYIGSVWKTYGQAQAETRYLHRLAGELRRLGCNGVIGNHGDTHSCRAEALNVYAFTRFGRDPAATPAGVIDEFAGHVADEATQDALAQVLRFIENHSSWQASLPPEDRLEDFDCGDLASAAEALRRLNQVTSRTHPTFPLPEPPADYLQRLRQRLEVLAALEGPPEAALAAQADALFAPLKAR
jgi:hypothetical protein